MINNYNNNYNSFEFKIVYRLNINKMWTNSKSLDKNAVFQTLSTIARIKEKNLNYWAIMITVNGGYQSKE